MTTSAVASRSISTHSPSVSPAHLAGRTISRVMIADDNPEIDRLLKARLEARGCIVQSAEDGEKALAQAQPDLLMDRSVLAALIDDTAGAAGIADRLIELGRAAGPLTDDLTIAVLRHSDPCQSTGNGSPATSAA